MGLRISTNVPAIAAQRNLSRSDERSAHAIMALSSGKRIVKVGDDDHTLYLVVSGEVDLLVEGPKGPVRILTVTEGSTFGEVGFFDHEPRSAHAIARGAVEVLALCPARLEQLVAWHPRLAHKLVMELGRVLSMRLRKLSRNWAVALAGRLP